MIKNNFINKKLQIYRSLNNNINKKKNKFKSKRLSLVHNNQ